MHSVPIRRSQIHFGKDDVLLSLEFAGIQRGLSDRTGIEVEDFFQIGALRGEVIRDSVDVGVGVV